MAANFIYVENLHRELRKLEELERVNEALRKEYENTKLSMRALLSSMDRQYPGLFRPAIIADMYRVLGAQPRND